VAPFGTVYNDLNYESNIVQADDKQRCYRSISPRRKNPNVKRAKQYFLKKKYSYAAAADSIELANPKSTDEAAEISRLQKQLRDQITKSVWEEKERVRLQQRIKQLQDKRQFTKRHFTRLERAYTATSIGDLPSGEVSITDSEVDPDMDKKKAAIKTPSDELKLATARYEHQMQQLFTTLQEERKLHQEKLAELNTRMTQLQQDNNKSKNQMDTKNGTIGGVPNTILTPQMNVGNSSSLQPDVPSQTPGIISATMESMLEKFSDLDDDSKKALMHHAITSNNEVLQSRLLKLRESNGNNYSIAKLTKEIIKLAETYKVPELKFDEQAQRRRFNFQSWIMK
jgi:hypothetical protein